MRKLTIIFLLIVTFGCPNDQTKRNVMHEQFSKELKELKEYFQIPGLAVLIKEGDKTVYEDYIGFAGINRQIPIDSTTTIPMASLTKIFSSILVLQLVENGKLSLNESINKYVNNPNIGDSIKIKHVLSHTSQGVLGQNFYYNNSRFMLLGEVIENSSEQSFKSRIYERIDMVFIVAANNNLMSDPARLIAGDVTYSLFALSFLKNFVFDLKKVPLFEDQLTLTTLSDRVTENNSEFYRKKLLAQAVTASFMGRFDDSEIMMSKNILKQVFETFSDYIRYGDLILLHNLNILKYMDSFRGKGEFLDFDGQLESIGKSLLEIDEYNPYANYYMANYYQGRNMIDRASFYYNQIINAINFSPWWYTQEAQNWIIENEKNKPTDFSCAVNYKLKKVVRRN